MTFRFKGYSALSVLIAINVGLLVLNAYALYRLYSYQAIPPSILDVMLKRPAAPQLVEYKDYVAIMLAGLSLMVTVLGIGLATIAIWGYGTIRDAAQKQAEKIARDVAQSVASRTAYEARDFNPVAGQRLAEALYADENEKGTSGSSPDPWPRG